MVNLDDIIDIQPTVPEAEASQQTASEQSQDTSVDTTTEEPHEQKPHKTRRRGCLLKLLLGVLLAPIWLSILLMVLVYLPPVQDWAVRYAAEVASEETGLDIRLERLRIRPLLDVDLQHLVAIDPEGGDTLLAVEHFVVDPDLSGILHGHVGVEAVDLNRGLVNSKNLIASLRLKGRIGNCHLMARDVDLNQGRAKVDELYLEDSDVDIAMRDTTIIDTTTSEPIQWRIDADDLRLTNTHVRFASRLDTVAVDGRFGSLHLEEGKVDLYTNHYTCRSLDADSAKVVLDMPYDALSLDATIGGIETRRADIDVKANRYTLPDLQLKGTTIRYAMSGMQVGATLDDLTLDGLLADVAANRYTLDDLWLKAPSIAYDVPGAKRVKALDVNHIALTDTRAQIGGIEANVDEGIYRGQIKQLSARERCGLRLEQLTSLVYYNGERLEVDDLRLRTPHSRLAGHANIRLGQTPREAIVKHFDAYLQTELSKRDVMMLAGAYLPDIVVENYPDKMLTLGVDIDGTLDDARIRSAYLYMPNLVEAKLSGRVDNLARLDRLKADVAFDARTYDLTLVKHLAGLGPDIDLPPMTLRGTATANAQQYATHLTLLQGEGSATLDAALDAHTMAYSADLATRQLHLRAFLPNLPLAPLTAKASIKGQGTDIYSPATHLTASAEVERLKYSIYNMAGLKAEADLHNGHARAALHSRSTILDADARVEGQLQRQLSSLDFDLDLRHIDARALGLVDYPLSASMQSHIEGRTNLSDTHWAEGCLSDITLTYRDTTYTHTDLDFSAEMLPDNLMARIQTGDLMARAEVEGSLDQVMARIDDTWNVLQRQMRQYAIVPGELTPHLPTVRMHVESGQDNIVYDYIKALGYGFDDLYVDLNANPTTGLDGEGRVDAFVKDSVHIDHISLSLGQDSTALTFDARAYNAPNDRYLSFDARLKGDITAEKAKGLFTVLDDERKTWFNVGLDFTMNSEGKRLTIIPHDPVLAYRNFRVNRDNYLYMGLDNRVEADVDLLADDGMGLKLYSTENADSTVLQDLTLGINHFNLGELCRVVPSLPNAAGFLSGDVHMVQTPDEVSFMCDLGAEDMAYDGTRIGNVGINAIYLPNQDGSQYVNGILTKDALNIAEVDGTYYPGQPEGTVDVNAHLLDLPMSLADAFTGGLMRFTGTLGGDVAITGPLSDFSIDGTLTTDSLHVLADEYSVNLRIADDSIRVAGNRLYLDQLRAYTTGATPLYLDGNINFTDFSNVRLQLEANARNFQLMNAGRTRGASAYGKLYVDFDATIRGNLDNITVNAGLDVLGKTDLTYVLKDSPLSQSDELADLVTFVNFNDSTQVAEEESTKPMNLTMNMDVHIDEAAMLHCMLSEDRTNYVNIEGGGDLLLTYDPRNQMRLYGRYTILEGDIKYSMLVVPLKNFSIASGSYVEFQGDMLNPALNITATERLTTTITENQSPRSVAFDVGLKISQTLEKMGLAFTIDAPDDISIQNELATMTEQQRGRVAVTMLATGMYLNEGSAGGSGFTASNALNAFLQSQISQLSSKALGSVDLSVGMENGTTSTGSTTMDYSFRFAKRFWNNRISVIIGGKVSTGSEAENTGQSIINNVSLEYRLDQSATRYVKLFYDRENASILEGEVTEMGAGIVLRKKTERLGELFLFRRKKAADKPNTNN